MLGWIDARSGFDALDASLAYGGWILYFLFVKRSAHFTFQVTDCALC